MARRVGLCDRRADCVILIQVTTLQFTFVEHLFHRDVWRPAIPVRIFMIETHCDDGAGADVGAAPTEPGGAEEFESNVEVRVRCRLIWPSTPRDDAPLARQFLRKFYESRPTLI